MGRFLRAGEALWPEKFPLAVLEQIRIVIGGADQQRPAAAEGMVFRREWWRFFHQQRLVNCQVPANACWISHAATVA
jgi:hypothetical protein